ncbi:hypothetical protein SAMN06272775_0063 [Streptomyces sp. 2323.1]|uniref:hypothetical protein n=1 Tax=Streptomyces sp. 2323.1 TaxID=1938841 RepID=UPI000BB784E0|nr:hypothetical protein [Streptomyces sp. 2323.1]SOE08985.1 hypothetical protein SAMN06272775_0063 [Streptomyces sp. 2323.1]
MATYTSIIYVTHAGYWVSEPTCNVSDNQGTEGNGLVGPGQGSATIQTGLEDGPVKVTVDIRETEPPVQTDGWDEIIEVSIPFESEDADIDSLGGTIGGWSEEIPITAAGPGWYRIRVHARGRDQGAQIRDLDLDDEPVEEHLIQTWPAPRAPEIRHKLTDTYGAEARARG